MPSHRSLPPVSHPSRATISGNIVTTATGVYSILLQAVLLTMQLSVGCYCCHKLCACGMMIVMRWLLFYLLLLLLATTCQRSPAAHTDAFATLPWGKRQLQQSLQLRLLIEQLENKRKCFICNKVVVVLIWLMGLYCLYGHYCPDDPCVATMHQENYVIKVYIYTRKQHLSRVKIKGDNEIIILAESCLKYSFSVELIFESINKFHHKYGLQQKSSKT